MFRVEDRPVSRLGSAQRAVEQIVLAANHSNIRVLGILAADRGAGVSTLCQQIARTWAQAGHKALLVDLTTQAPAAGTKRAVWRPDKCPSELIEQHRDGYSVIHAPPAESRGRFNNSDELRKLLVEDLAGFERVVLDLPAVLNSEPEQINPVAVARACDAVILVCVTGRTTQDQIKRTMSALSLAGVQLGGTVLNDVEEPD